MVKAVVRKHDLAQNSPKELSVSFKGKIKTRGANLDQKSRRETSNWNRPGACYRVEQWGCQIEGNWIRRIVNIFTAIWHPLIIQMTRLPERSPKRGEWGKEGVCLGRGSWVLHAFNVCFLEMFYITYKIIYITGDVGKWYQKEMEGLLLLKFSFQVSKNQVIGKKRYSFLGGSIRDQERIRKAGFLLICATDMLPVSPEALQFLVGNLQQLES